MDKQIIHLEDGRLADKVIQEVANSNGESKIITEVFAEPKVEKKLMQRVVETKRPVIVRREIEDVDESGEVISRRVESSEPAVKLELREHIETNALVSALSATEDCNCYVTQEDVQKTVLEAVAAIGRLVQENKTVAAPTLTAKEQIEQKFSNFNLGGVTENSNMSTYLMMAIAALAGVFIYLWKFS